MNEAIRALMWAQFAAAAIRQVVAGHEDISPAKIAEKATAIADAVLASYEARQ